MRFITGVTLGMLVILFGFIWTGLAFDFDLIPTTEQADKVYSLEMEYRNTIQQVLVQAKYYHTYQDNCELEEAYFVFDKKKVECDEVQNYFRTQYYKITDLAHKLDGYCNEYFGVSGKECSLFVDKFRS